MEFKTLRGDLGREESPSSSDSAIFDRLKPTGTLKRYSSASVVLDYPIIQIFRLTHTFIRPGCALVFILSHRLIVPKFKLTWRYDKNRGYLSDLELTNWGRFWVIRDNTKYPKLIAVFFRFRVFLLERHVYCEPIVPYILYHFY